MTKASPTSVSAMASHTGACATTVHGTDHQHDLASSLQQAQAVCQQRGVRLTTLRLQVFELILKSARPLGAYDLLSQMTVAGRAPAPPTVYRSLEFLLEQGLIHRLASINAFVACCHPRDRHDHQTAFLICEQCRQVSEADSQPVREALHQLAETAHFALKHTVIELSGLCHDCQQIA